MGVKVLKVIVYSKKDTKRSNGSKNIKSYRL